MSDLTKKVDILYKIIIAVGVIFSAGYLVIDRVEDKATGVESLRKDVSELSSDVDEIKVNISDLKKEIKKDISELRENVREDIIRLGNKIDKILLAKPRITTL